MVERGNQHVLTPPSLHLTDDVSTSWSNWVERWEDYTVVTEMQQKTTQYQCSMLRYCFSEETRKIYNSLKLTKEEKKDPDKIIRALEIFVNGAINITEKRYLFNCRTQGEGESFQDFLSEVNALSSKCNYCENCREGIIRDRVVVGVRNETVREKLLSHSNLTLKKAEHICRELEKTLEEAKVEQEKLKAKEEIIQPLSNGIHQHTKIEKENLQSEKYGSADVIENGHEADAFTPNEVVMDTNEIPPSPSKSSVKVVRRMITKCRESKNNILKGLQILKNKQFQYGSIPYTKYDEREKYDESAKYNDSITAQINDELYNGMRISPLEEKLTEKQKPQTLKTKDPVAIQHCITKEWSLKGAIETEVAPGTYTVKLNDGRLMKRNISDIRSVQLTNNTYKNKLIVSEAISKLFQASCHVTPSDLIEDHLTATKERKMSDDPDTYIEHDMSSDNVESLPYDENSFTDRTTISSFSGNEDELDELSDTIDYDMDPDEENEYDIKVINKGQGNEKEEENLENEEYIFTTYM